jgi:hypothetical protein
MSLDEATSTLRADWARWNAALREVRSDYARIHRGNGTADEAMVDIRHMLAIISARMGDIRKEVDDIARAAGYDPFSEAEGSTALRRWLHTFPAAPQ